MFMGQSEYTSLKLRTMGNTNSIQITCILISVVQHMQELESQIK